MYTITLFANYNLVVKFIRVVLAISNALNKPTITCLPIHSSMKFTTKENISNLVLNIHKSNLIMAITYLFQAIKKNFHEQTSDLVPHLLLYGWGKGYWGPCTSLIFKAKTLSW